MKKIFLIIPLLLMIACGGGGGAGGGGDDSSSSSKRVKSVTIGNAVAMSPVFKFFMPCAYAVSVGQTYNAEYNTDGTVYKVIAPKSGQLDVYYIYTYDADKNLIKWEHWESENGIKPQEVCSYYEYTYSSGKLSSRKEFVSHGIDTLDEDGDDNTTEIHLYQGGYSSNYVYTYDAEGYLVKVTYEYYGIDYTTGPGATTYATATIINDSEGRPITITIKDNMGTVLEIKEFTYEEELVAFEEATDKSGATTPTSYDYTMEEKVVVDANWFNKFSNIGNNFPY